MKKTCCALGIGALIGIMFSKKKNCKKCSNDMQSSSSQEDTSTLEDGLTFILDKIESLDLENLKSKTKETIESIKRKVVELRQ